MPAILGEKLIDTFDLKPKSNGYFMEYNDDLPISTLNSVSNAILPFIVSMMPPNLSYFSADGVKRGSIPTNETYWAPFDVHDPFLVQELVLGLTLTPAQKVSLAMASNTKLCK